MQWVLANKTQFEWYNNTTTKDTNANLHLDIFELTHNVTESDANTLKKFNNMRIDASEDLQSGAITTLIGLSGITVIVVLMFLSRGRK